MDQFLKQMGAFLRGLSPRQRVLLGVSAALVAAVIVLFTWLTRNADFKTLYSGLAPEDAQEVVQSLAARNIPYQISTDGSSVSIPASQLDKTRLALASEGMPRTGRLGFELFDKPNWAGSDFAEQVNYQRALEGELERTIQTLGNVESVRVHLVLPHESLFSDRERVAKAAVVLKLRGGGLTEDETNAVTHLVASAVDGLTPENVTLIGADGRTPLVAKGHSGIKGEDAPAELETSLAEKLVATLAPVVGPDHVKASVTVAYDESSGDTTQEIYDPANPVLAASQVQEESFGGSPPAGIPGTPSNVPVAPANSASSSSGKAGKPGQTGTPKSGAVQANPGNPIVSISSESGGQRSESRTYDVSKTLRHTIEPPGRIQKIAAAVLVDDVIEQKKGANGQMQEIRHKRSPEEMKQIQELAQAAIGFDAARGDTVSVQNVSFINTPYEAPPLPPIAERIRVVTEKWIWLARYLLLLFLFFLIYALVLRPVKNLLLIAFQGPERKIAGPALAGIGAGDSEGGAALAGAQASGIDIGKELDEATSDVDRIVKMKRHLAERVKSEPSAASQLVRQWINEKKGS